MGGGPWGILGELRGFRRRKGGISLGIFKAKEASVFP